MWLNGIDHSFPQPDLYEVIDKINAAFPELSVTETVGVPEEDVNTIVTVLLFIQPSHVAVPDEPEP